MTSPIDATGRELSVAAGKSSRSSQIIHFQCFLVFFTVFILFFNAFECFWCFGWALMGWGWFGCGGEWMGCDGITTSTTTIRPSVRPSVRPTLIPRQGPRGGTRVSSMSVVACAIMPQRDPRELDRLDRSEIPEGSIDSIDRGSLRARSGIP